ncbi:FAD/NAD P-binding domain-containing protein [Gloeophyllum trabeum ATCC 11539]|uniref:FAD/NAD P-binding domain-containing protein n=1 Tax=Gloeophyllum trabeum (strain ATCC 11539 / FP-39264 / Madison 617) TaxID=670483 RepID=S7RYV3_GLOTA|nr:FAD/NAD P-binding domain-containing protein [Gloeophyllum trabeum ATCC 11539]EPQ58594.1 FAD/NAD P-binding domain-containing protein [Gloeophyllum trabeum ATCC 11539]
MSAKVVIVGAGKPILSLHSCVIPFTSLYFGPGPSGLVACKTLLEAATHDFPFDPIVLEQEDDIGDTFQYRFYENTTLMSSKQLISLSHSDHLTLEQYVNYLRDYASHFNLWSRIHLACKVVNILKDPQGGHNVSYHATLINHIEAITIHTPYVAICTGLHVVPHVPDIPGVDNALKNNPEAKLFHSSEYKSRDQLRGKEILILGTGETGMDIAYESAKAGAKEVVLCSRAGFLSFPKALNDFSLLGFKFESKSPVPIDSLITNLGETTYVHPWVAKSHTRWFISDFVIKRVLWVLTGTQAGCNQWIGELEPEHLGRAYVFLNKSHKALPYINRPYRLIRTRICPRRRISRSNWLPSPRTSQRGGRAICPLDLDKRSRPKRKDAVRIQGKVVKPNLVVYATGYEQKFGFLGEGYKTPGEADVRNICWSGDTSVAFIGFFRPGVGAIPPISEIQSMFWVLLLKDQVCKPLRAAHYHLLVNENTRIKYGVDHSTYVSTLICTDTQQSPRTKGNKPKPRDMGEGGPRQLKGI